MSFLQRKACVQSFVSHEAGASCLAFASQHQTLVTGGKKGTVCLWDLRQMKLLQSFKAHDHPVKCISLEDSETMFVTGSADGDIRVWDLVSHRSIHFFPQEHARHGLFKNISQGVAQV